MISNPIRKEHVVLAVVEVGNNNPMDLSKVARACLRHATIIGKLQPYTFVLDERPEASLILKDKLHFIRYIVRQVGQFRLRANLSFQDSFSLVGSSRHVLPSTEPVFPFATLASLPLRRPSFPLWVVILWVG